MWEGLRYWAAAMAWGLATCLAAGAGSTRGPASGSAPASSPARGPVLMVQVSPKVRISELAIRLALGLDKSYTVVVADATALTQQADFLLQITLISVRFTDRNSGALGLMDNNGKPLQRSWKDAKVSLGYVVSARPKPGVHRKQVAKGVGNASVSPLEHKGSGEGKKPTSIITYTHYDRGRPISSTTVDQDGNPVMEHYALRKWTPDQVRTVASVESLVAIQREVRSAIQGGEAQGKLQLWFPTVFDRTPAKETSPRDIAIAAMFLDTLSSASSRPTTAPATPEATREATPEDRAAAKVRLAQSYLAAGKTAAARRILDRVVKDFPDTSAAGQAREQLKELPASNAPPGGK